MIPGLSAMFSHDYLQSAFLAGTGVAMAAGMVGYFVVLRAQVFAVDALSHAAVTGALGALAFGIDPRLGLFASTVAFAAVLGLVGQKGRADDVVTGSVFAWMLGLGVLFLGIYARTGATGDSQGGTSVLFGSIFGLSRGDAVLALLVGLAVTAVMVAIARPLLFATLNEIVAAGRGVPVRALGMGFLVLVGVTAGEASQAVGGLLLLGLLAGPAAIAHRICVRPFRGLLVAVVIAVGAVWVGLTMSYLFSQLPPSFSIMSVIALAYLGSGVMRGRLAHSGPVRDADRSRETSRR